MSWFNLIIKLNFIDRSVVIDKIQKVTMFFNWKHGVNVTHHLSIYSRYGIDGDFVIVCFW